MDISSEFWFLLPISILVASIAMASGIGGAVFFSPIFILWLKLEPTVAVGTALLTELFGFSSGLIAYVRAGRIDYALAKSLLVFSIPAAVLGILFIEHIPAIALKAIFATGLISLGSQLYNSWQREEKEKLDQSIACESVAKQASKLVDRDGNVFSYTICHKAMGRTFAAVGGLFLGMISVGLAELQEYHLVAKCRVPSQVAIATSIFVVVGTVLVAVIGHGYTFVTSASDEALGQVAGVAMFTVPGVVIGGQVGPKVGALLDPDLLKVGVSILFMLVGGLMLVTVAI